MVVVVADRWDAAAGGREQYAADLQRFLLSRGHAVVPATPRDPLPAGARCVLALAPLRAATHYQLHGGLIARAFAAERESFESSVRRALFNRALALNRRRQRLLDDEAAMFAGSAALMTFCEADGAALRAIGVAPSRIIVSRPGIDRSRFMPPADLERAAATEPLRLAFAAHNAVLKGLDAALRATARAVRGGIDATLTVAGRGPSHRFERLADREGIATRVTFAGPLSQSAIAALFAGSHAIVHPTFYDPFPRVIVEAMACGCAAITTRRCGAAEIVTGGREGYIVDDPRDVESLATAIAAISDPSRRTTMRMAAATLAERFAQDTHFEATSAWLLGPRPA